MREKLMTLTLAQLKQFAKDQGIAHFSTMKKPELVDALVAVHEAAASNNGMKKSGAETAVEKKPKSRPARRKSPSSNDQKNPRSSDEAVSPLPESPLTPEAKENATEPDRVDPDYFIGEGFFESLVDKDSKDYGYSSISKDSKDNKDNKDSKDNKDYGFIRTNGYLQGYNDIYVAGSQIRRFGLKTGDYIVGQVRSSHAKDKKDCLVMVQSINGIDVSVFQRPIPFENLTPTFPHDRLRLETANSEISVRIIDLLSPIGKGQRGLIVAQPKVGKTTLLKQIASSLTKNHPELYIMILLIDERPEEVTDMKDTFEGQNNVEIIYSTFDELPERHRKISEMVIERAKRLVEVKRDVVILLDSITRLTRACNLSCVPSGRTLSGGLDPAALNMPKRFFGAARCMREGGSLTILATALQETGSRLDDVVYEEFKGTGNMELVLNRKLSERRIFPAIDILKSSTRRDDLLLTSEEQEAAARIHRSTTLSAKPEVVSEEVLDLFANTRSNSEFISKLAYSPSIR